MILFWASKRDLVFFEGAFILPAPHYFQPEGACAMSQPRVEVSQVPSSPQPQVVQQSSVNGRVRKLPIRQDGEAGRVHDENCAQFTSHGEDPCNCGVG